MKRAEIITKIYELLNDAETKAELINELDSWNGYLGDDRRYNMDDFDELFCGKSPIDIAQMAAWGSDDEGCDYFRTDRNYFYFDGYANIVSTDSEIDVDDYDDGELIDIVEREGYGNLYFYNEELEQLFESLEECEE